MDRTQVICASLFGAALVAAVTFLAWHGTIDGQAAIGFFTGLSFAGIVGGVQHVATKSGAAAATAGAAAATSGNSIDGA